MTVASLDMAGYGGNEKSSGSGDTDYAGEAASGGIFTSDYKKYDDLKVMLDSNKDNLKLEAMKRIIGMVAKGRDASELFAAVVKNVVSSNLEVKKLVYVYLVRYAEEQQDLALLSISTFQRALKDPNQLIRACALRVLSSIRVQVIVPIMMLALKEGVMDMSPYVRKTVAHAIPKLYSLDPEQKTELIEVLERLLSDNTTLVMGSAIMAFEEVCPERIDLIHRHYRKLCVLLVEVEEWGQVVIINMLTRYARTQFLDPNAKDNEHKRTGKSNDDDDEEDESEPEFYAANEASQKPMLDHDHRLLLRNTRPLLQSRNSAVVLAVAQLYQHIAPKSEVNEVVKAMVRLLRSHREIQAVVLSNIASMTTLRKGLFEPHLKSFFVRSCDPTHIKILKLEVLTNLASESNVSFILRECQTYLGSGDNQFVAATIQAIGRIASNITSVTDSCLSGLVTLLSHRDECVVGESVVVVRKLLQTEAVPHKDIIRHMSRLLPSIRIASARASILWLLGEHCDKVPHIAPDVLRLCCKGFCTEEDSVKLQILTLATKLQLTNPQQTLLLCQYVYNLCKYDTNYDIRDRARLLRAVVLPPAGAPATLLTANARNLFMAAKPPPLQQSTFKDREQFQLGTLSHFINARAAGYKELPDFPEEAPDVTVRSVPGFSDDSPKKEKKASKSSRKQHAAAFYSSASEAEEAAEDGGKKEEEEEESESSDESGSEEESEEESSTSSSGSESESSDEETESSSEESDDSDEEDESEEASSSDDDSDELVEVNSKNKLRANGPPTAPSKATVNASSTNAKSSVKTSKVKGSKHPKSNHSDTINLLNGTGDAPMMNTSPKPAPPSNLDLLLGLEEVPPTIDTPMLTPSLGGLLSPSQPANDSTNKVPVSAAITPGHCVEVLNRVSGSGVAVKATFTRSPHLYCPSMASVQLSFSNTREEPIKSISMEGPSSVFHCFPSLSNIAPNSTVHATLGIDYQDSSQPASFTLIIDDVRHSVTIVPRIGELMKPTHMDDTTFLKHQNSLRGMHEQSASNIAAKVSDIPKTLLTHCNLHHLTTSSTDLPYRLCGETLSGRCAVLVVVSASMPDSTNVNMSVHCDKLTVASMLLKELTASLTAS